MGIKKNIYYYILYIKHTRIILLTLDYTNQFDGATKHLVYGVIPSCTEVVQVFVTVESLTACLVIILLKAFVKITLSSSFSAMNFWESNIIPFVCDNTFFYIIGNNVVNNIFDRINLYGPLLPSRSLTICRKWIHYWTYLSDILACKRYRFRLFLKTIIPHYIFKNITNLYKVNRKRNKNTHQLLLDLKNLVDWSGRPDRILFLVP